LSTSLSRRKIKELDAAPEAIEKWKKVNNVFHCQKLKCDVSLRICVERQNTVKEPKRRGHGLFYGSHDFVVCDDCGQGIDNALKLETLKEENKMGMDIPTLVSTQVEVVKPVEVPQRDEPIPDEPQRDEGGWNSFYCAMEDCNQEATNRGLCKTHYKKWNAGRCLHPHHMGTPYQGRFFRVDPRVGRNASSAVVVHLEHYPQIIAGLEKACGPAFRTPEGQALYYIHACLVANGYIDGGGENKKPHSNGSSTDEKLVWGNPQ
jgi:hypothetical protein